MCMEISQQLYAAFDQFERDDLSALNEFDRHYEHAFYLINHYGNDP